MWAHHSLTFRLNANRGDNDNPNDRVGGFVQPNAAQLSITQSVGSQAALNSVFGTAVNQFRISYANTIPSNTRALYPQISIVKPNFSTEGGSANSIVRTETAQVGDVYNWNSRRHSFHGGGDYIRVLARDYSFTPFGEYRFAGPKIQQYTQTFGAAQLRYGQTIATAFLQDDIHWTPKLTANIGLRHELQSITSDRNNFAPRIGVAYDPTGKGSTVIRAGAGLFYDQYYLYITRRFYTQGLNSPTASYTLFPGDPGFPQFPNSLSDPPARAAAARRDIYLPPSRILNPYSMQFSLGIQQKLFGGWLLTLDGIHAHTMKQMRVRDANAPAPFPRTAPGQMRTAAQADATRAVSEFRTMAIIENSGSSLYDAADLGLSRRFARHYQVEAHYVYLSSANYSMFFGEPDTGIPNDWGNTGSAERGPSDFYQRHRFVGHGVLFLPYDVQFAGVATFGSGLPVNPLTGADNNGDGIQSDRPAGFGRNSFRGSSQANVDLSLSKRVRITERVALECRGEVFNVGNRLNAIKVNAIYGNGAYPLSTFLRPIAGLANSDPARQFQFAMRLIW